MWLFLDKPLEADTAIEFAKLARRKAGIQCEIFPSSRRSKCLKLPGSLHPKTGAMEEFIDLKTRHSFDTQIVCQMLAEGYYRTPYTAIVDWVNVEGSNIPQLPTKPKETYNELAASEDLAAFLLQLTGRNFYGLGKPFCCILPGHEERYPSAQFYRSSNGTIVYHDYHCSRYGTPEFLTLAEVYYALMTGKIIKLTPVEGGRWLAELALRAGVFNDLAIQQKSKLECFDTLFNEWYSKSNLSDSVLKVWEIVKSEVMISALSGFTEIKLSTRFLAEKAGITSSQANRAINLLCCLGFLQKVPSSGGMKGDRFVIGKIDLEQINQRWEALNISSIKQLNYKLVSERLDKELAASIFRGITKLCIQ